MVFSMSKRAYTMDLNGQFQKGGIKFTLFNRDVLSNKIVNILFTVSNANSRLGTRWFEPTFGGSLEQFLWEPVDEGVANNIKTLIHTHILRWLPEIDLKFNDIDIFPDPYNQCYKIDLYWKDKRVSELGQTSFKVYTHSNLDVIGK